MDTIRFVKSFSKGQITIPKSLRDSLGMTDDFWLKLYAQNGRIIAEPVNEEKNKVDYAKKLLTVKGKWFSADEIVDNRKQIEKQLEKRAI